MSIHQVLQFLVQNQATPALVSTPVVAPIRPIVEPIPKEWAQGVTPDTGNLSAAQCLANATEEHKIVVRKTEVGTLVDETKRKLPLQQHVSVVEVAKTKRPSHHIRLPLLLNYIMFNMYYQILKCDGQKESILLVSSMQGTILLQRGALL